MRLVFMGTPEAAVASLRRCLDDGNEVVAVWTQPDKPAGRGDRLRASAVKEFALTQGLKVEQPAKIKAAESIELFKSYQADVVVVVAYGRILPVEYLKAPAKGCINVHFSLLPKYRGAAPVNWAIINGEIKTGVTTMFIVEELDAGPILLQASTNIRDSETAPDLQERLATMGAALLSETLRDLGRITPKPQNDEEASLAPILRKEDGWIDWTQKGVKLERRIRGLQPWPNAFTQRQSQRLIIWRAEVVNHDDKRVGWPGEVLVAQGDNLIVQCGDETALRIFELQPENKRRMSSRDYLNGTPVKPGERLG